MKTHSCCRAETVEEPARPPASPLRRGREIASWLVPGLTLALLPKCPFCVAAYVVLFSGISISVTTAAYLRTSVLILCVTVLLFLAIRRLRQRTHFVSERCLAKTTKEAKG